MDIIIALVVFFFLALTIFWIIFIYGAVTRTMLALESIAESLRGWAMAGYKPRTPCTTEAPPPHSQAAD